VKGLLALAGLVGIFGAANAQALSYSTDLGLTYSGTAPASGENPWLRATFEDIGGGKVRLTMDAPNLTASEFVGIWTFNLNPAVSASALTFSVSSLDPGLVDVDSIKHSASGQDYKAGPEKYFDILFDFQNSMGPGRFTAGERLVYDIGFAGGTLAAEDFLFVNQQKSGSKLVADDWYSAAHVQSIGNNGSKSGWIGAGGAYENEEPPPSHPVTDHAQTIMLMGAACLGLVILRSWSGR
jgi:hypothetical protein